MSQSPFTEETEAGDQYRSDAEDGKRVEKADSGPEAGCTDCLEKACGADTHGREHDASLCLQPCTAYRGQPAAQQNRNSWRKMELSRRTSEYLIHLLGKDGGDKQNNGHDT